MNKSTMFIALLFAFTTIFSLNTSAAYYTDPDGDGGQPLLELWIYGITLPAGTPEVGDEVAIYDGGTLVGTMTLTVVPSTANWVSSQMIAYGFNNSGSALYTPGNPFFIKYYDVSATTEYVAYGWGDGEAIDFHNSWFAPTSEDAGATTTGAFFPPSGASSYCYVELTCVAGSIPTNATVTVTIWEDDGITPVIGATVSAGGYTATDNTDGTYTLDLYSGGATDTDDYDYTVTVSKSGFGTETFDKTLTAVGGPYTQTVYLDGKGNLTGTVKAYSINTSSMVIVENATVSATIYGTVYSDNTDGSGVYLISDIPDGTWGFTYSYPDHVSQTINRVIDYDGSTNTVAGSADLDLETGTISGEIFDATTVSLINTQNVDVKLYSSDGLTLLNTESNTDGTYNFSYYGGVYDIVVSSTGYDDVTIDDYILYQDYTETINFNLLPTGTAANYTAITGSTDDLWSIYIEMAKFGPSHLLPWDELVIFDTDETGIGSEPGRRVGTLRLTKEAVYQNSATNILKAYGEFTGGSPGFTQGHNIEIWAYDISHDEVYETPLEWWFNPGVGTYSGTTFPDPSGSHVSYLNIYWDTPTLTLNGTVSDNLGTVDGVTVEVLNVYTQNVLYTTTTSGGGLYSFDVSASTYDIRFTKSGYTTILSEDVLVQSAITTHNVTFASRISTTIEYDFAASGYYFIGRAIEKGPAADEMLTLLDNYAAPSVASFSTTLTSSWVENDGSTRLAHDGSNWEPVNTTPGSFDWELLEGYQLYLEGAYSFEMSEYMVIPGNNPITFPSAGIYYIPYFPYSASSGDWDDALTAFSGILSDLDWVMDSDGNRLHDDNGGWTDNIGTLSPAQGYKIKMNAGATLTYPESKKSAKREMKSLDPVHFIFTGGNAADWTYTIHINTEDFEIGDEIAAYSNGIMVGAMVIDSDNAWENDLNTFYKAVNGGYAINSSIEFVAWDASNGNEYSVAFEMVEINEAAFIGRVYPAGLDHFSYTNVYRGTVEIDENHLDKNIKLYPNPTNRTLNIESVSNINTMSLYNIYGALVLTTSVNSNNHQIDVSNLTAGTYVMQLHTINGVVTKRIIIK
jgi:type IX secretion system substrate protein